MKKNTYELSLDDLEILFSTNPLKEFSLSAMWLNETNAPSWYVTFNNIEFNYKIIRPKGYDIWYQFSFVYLEKIVQAFSIIFWKSTGVKSSNVITIYSTWLRVLWNDKIKQLLDDNFNTQNFIGLRRFDIALDLPFWKYDLIDTFKTEPKHTRWFDSDKWNYETYYFWDRKNRTVLLRIYDKIRETIKRNKTFMFDFWDNKEVTRCELEFWKNFIDSVNKNNKNNITLDHQTLLDNPDNLYKTLYFSNIVDKVGYFSSVEFSKLDFTYIRSWLSESLESYYLEYWQLPIRYKWPWLWTFRNLYKILWAKAFYSYIFEDEKNFHRNIKELTELHNDTKKIKLSKKNNKNQVNQLDLHKLIDDINITLTDKNHKNLAYAYKQFNFALKKINLNKNLF